MDMPARPTRTVSTRFWFRLELTLRWLPTQTATARPPRLPRRPSTSPAVTQRSSNYPNMVIDATRTNSTPFQVQTSNSFPCGTIDFDLNLTFPNGSKTVPIAVPTCTGGADQTIPPSTLTASDLTQ